MRDSLDRWLYIPKNKNTSIVSMHGVDFSVNVGDKDHLDVSWSHITLTQSTIDQLGWWDINTASIMYYGHIFSQIIASRWYEKYIINAVLLADLSWSHGFLSSINLSSIDTNQFSVYFQAFFALIYRPELVSTEVRDILSTSIPNKDDTAISFESIYRNICANLSKQNLIDEYTNFAQGKSNKPAYKDLLVFLYRIWQEHGIWDALRKLEISRKQINQTRTQQERKKEDHSQDRKENKDQQQYIQQDSFLKQDSYNPQDSIRNNESWPQILRDSWQAPIIWYIKTNSMQSFDINSLRWSAVNKTFEKITDDTSIVPTYWHTVHAGRSGNYEYNLPYGYKPVFVRGDAVLHINQSGDHTLQVQKPGEIKVWLVECSIQDKDNYDYSQVLIDHLSTNISDYLSSYDTPLSKLNAVKSYILSKIYSTNYQGSVVDASSSQDDYIYRLWEAPKLECYSANHLFVAMARYLWYEAKLTVWYRTSFVYGNKSYITANDGHAWAELKVWDSWQVVDVTPTVPDPDDLYTGTEDDDLQEEDRGDMLDTDIMSDTDKQDLMSQFQQSDPLEVKVLIQEWISPEQARSFYDMMEKVKPRAKKLANRLEKLFEYEDTIEEKISRHTASTQTKIDIQRILTQEPGVIIGDAESLTRLSKVPYYIKDHIQYITKKTYPDEIILTCTIDVSGSMDDYQEVTKEYITLLWMTFWYLYAMMKKHGTQVKMECRGFWSDSKKYIWDKGDLLTLSMDSKPMITLANLFAKIPDKMQNQCGSGNSENDFYERIIYEDIKKYALSSKYNIQKIGVSFTDQQTLTDSNRNDGKSIKMPDGTTLWWKNSRTRLSDLLSYLQNKCNMPMIAVNTSGHGKVRDSGYAYYVTADKNMDDKLYDILSTLIWPSINNQII